MVIVMVMITMATVQDDGNYQKMYRGQHDNSKYDSNSNNSDD